MRRVLSLPRGIRGGNRDQRSGCYGRRDQDGIFLACACSICLCFDASADRPTSLRHGMPDGAVTSPFCRTPRRRPGAASESHRDRSDRGCRDPAPAHRAVQPHILSAEDVDRVFGTDGALALAQLGQPEIGVRMVGRPWIQIEIELEDDMQGLKLGIAPIDRGTEDLPDPLGAICER